MKKWEYTTRHRPGNDFYNLGSKEEFLNYMGNDGWELVSVVHNLFRDGRLGVATYDFYFKREVQVNKRKES